MPQLTATPPDEIAAFMDCYSPETRRTIEWLRAAMLRAVPSAVEKLRPGWRLIGYDLPVTRHGTYFAWIWPEVEHVHVGWQVGTLMADPDGQLRGAHLKLKKVRYLTYEPGERPVAKLVVDFTRDAARIASMSRGERALLHASREDDGGFVGAAG
ncbi:MAG: hypothetical protein ABIP53_09875 [Candidatus Limnocylindrales bacterium]